MNREWMTLNHAVAAQRLMNAWRVDADVAEAIGERLRQADWKGLKIELLNERIAYLESQVPAAPAEPELPPITYRSEWE